MSGTTGMRRAASVLLVAALLVSVGVTGAVEQVAAAISCDPAAADCPVEPTLAPPGDQERVKDDDTVTAGGTIHRDWTITSAEIRYLRADGSLARSPLPVALTRNSSIGHDRLGGEFHIGPTNGAATIHLRVSVERSSDGETYVGASAPLEVDHVEPSIVGYHLVAPDRIRVAFSEPVRRPDGAGGYRDNPLDWTIDGQSARAVEGSADRRVLVLNQRYADGDRPIVEYVPAAGAAGSFIPVRTYQDLASRSLSGENRVAYAGDGIPPEIPDILDVNGSTADPTIGASTTPRVRVGKLDGASRVQLWRDSLQDGDRNFEPGRDVLLAETPVPSGATDVTFAAADYSQPLPAGDATHTLYARSVDQADNPSPGVDSARYRLDPTVPVAVSATGDGRFVTVRFSEDVHGTNRPGDWTVTSGGPVESVTGSGSVRVVRTASPATGHISWTPPAGSGLTPYRDVNGNQVEAFRLEIRRPGDIRAADATAVEGTALNFTVTLARPSGDTSTYRVDYVTEDGTATLGEDYTSRSGRLTFSGDETSLAVLVPTVEDDRPEGPETVTLRLSNPSGGATVAAPGTATGTITDTATATGDGVLSIFDTRAHEGATARAVIQLASAVTEDVTVRWATRDGTAKAGSDYTAGSGTARIAKGARETTVTVPLLEDDATESTEQFTIRLSDPVNATLQRPTATVSILDGAGTPPGVGRVDGPSRVETSAEVSKAFYATADTVLVATANAYPDALAGAPLAEKHGAPILLTTRERLHPAIASEVRRLGARTAYVLGGANALTAQVDRDLRAAGVATVHRLAGTNRFDTARLIAAEVGGSDVYVVEGNNRDPKRGWPDAVAVSALAAAQQRPILLVERDRLPGETAAALDRLRPARATVVGGPAAVNEAVKAAVDARAGAVDRVAGRTRYETSRAVATRAVSAGFDPGNTFFATGDDWPDSLSASPAVARTGGILLLVDSDRLDDSPPAREWLVTHRDRLRSITLIGGTKAISAAVAEQIRSQSGLQPR